MMVLSTAAAEELYQAARSAAAQAYAPYSRLRVGAAVLTKSGRVFSGANIENVSYGLTVCAERVAIGNTLSSGLHDIHAIAIYSLMENITPCGACRQFILEFGKDIIVVFRLNEQLLQLPVSELLPYAFNEEMLQQKTGHE